jgi:hypothetical protein
MEATIPSARQKAGNLGAIEAHIARDRAGCEKCRRIDTGDPEKQKAPHGCEAFVWKWLPETGSNRRPSD